MPLRFRRTIQVAPGVKLNVSKSGVSTTVGSKGVHFNIGKRGIRRTVNIPGTGISEVDYIKKNETEAEKKKGKAEEAREEERDDTESHASQSDGTKRKRRSRHSEAAVSRSSLELRNAFVLLGVVVFFFAGAAMLGFVPPHLISNSLQFLAHVVQSTGH